VRIAHDVGGTIAWSPRSPDLTPLYFAVWAYVQGKYRVLNPPVPKSMEELQARITQAGATMDADMSHRIWDEIAYRWDMCRVTRGNHIEQL